MEWKSRASVDNPNWKYVPAAGTDVSKTIARVKREMKELEELKAREEKAHQDRIIQIKRNKTG